VTVLAASGSPAAPPPRISIYRHGLVVRLTHWINVLAISLLLMSGLNIFNAHPRLYWGAAGADFDPAWLEMKAAGNRGLLRIGALSLDTTGVLGLSRASDGSWNQQGFPDAVTFPGHRDLATARRWHFFLAWLFVINGAIYYLSGLITGHLRRDIAPARRELAPGALWTSVVDHLKLRHPVGEAARRYNVLQKLAYLAVIVILLPLMVLTGLTMSPGVDAAVPWLVSLFGGRQSARAIHFITANLIVLFVIVHLVEVVLAGVWNEIRSMITGRYVVPAEKHR
jgi:thiosulfate reductase cytochrome b subunit